MLSDVLKIRLLLGWLIGSVTSFIGLYLSATFDFPTGAAIVCTFGIVVLIVAAIKNVFQKS